MSHFKLHDYSDADSSTSIMLLNVTIMTTASILDNRLNKVKSVDPRMTISELNGAEVTAEQMGKAA